MNIEPYAVMLKSYWIWIIVIAVGLTFVGCVLQTNTILNLVGTPKINLTQDIPVNDTIDETPRLTIKDVYFNNTGKSNITFKKVFVKKTTTIKDVYNQTNWSIS